MIVCNISLRESLKNKHNDIKIEIRKKEKRNCKNIFILESDDFRFTLLY